MAPSFSAARGPVAALAALGLALTLASCADAQTDGTSAVASGPVATTSDTPAVTESVDPAHNDADVAFAQQMIPHHGQAVVMADMALQVSDDPDLLALAQQIRDAQEPEIQTMTGYLVAWGEAVPESSDGMGMDGDMDMGDGTATGDFAGMNGMMSADDMGALGAATGMDFDRMWPAMMIEHHEGAIQMAQVELADGENPQIKELAQNIIDAQQAEIVTMQGMLDG